MSKISSALTSINSSEQDAGPVFYFKPPTQTLSNNVQHPRQTKRHLLQNKKAHPSFYFCAKFSRICAVFLTQAPFFLHFCPIFSILGPFSGFWPPILSITRPCFQIFAPFSHFWQRFLIFGTVFLFLVPLFLFLVPLFSILTPPNEATRIIFRPILFDSSEIF